MVETGEATPSASRPIPVTVKYTTPPFTPANLGLRIKHVRRELRISQAELASHIGVHVTTLKNWESGQVMPQHSNMERLCRLIETDNPSQT